MVIGVESHIFSRQITGIKPNRLFSKPHLDFNQRFPSGFDQLRNSTAVKWHRCPVLKQQRAIESQHQPAGVKLHARLARCRNDSTPIWICSGNRRFDQWAVGNRTGNLPSGVARRASAHLNPQHMRGPFAVVGNLASE